MSVARYLVESFARRRCAAWIALVAGVLLLACGSGQRAAALEIVVPAYFYPSAGSPWGPMTAAATEVPITAIITIVFSEFPGTRPVAVLLSKSGRI